MNEDFLKELQDLFKQNQKTQAIIKIINKIDRSPENIKYWEYFIDMSLATGTIKNYFDKLLNISHDSIGFQVYRLKIVSNYGQAGALLERYPDIILSIIQDYINQNMSFSDWMDLSDIIYKLATAQPKTVQDYSLASGFIAIAFCAEKSNDPKTQEALSRLVNDADYAGVYQKLQLFLQYPTAIGLEEIKIETDIIQEQKSDWMDPKLDHNDAWMQLIKQMITGLSFGKNNYHEIEAVIAQKLHSHGLNLQDCLVFMPRFIGNVGDNFAFMGLMSEWGRVHGIKTIPLINQARHQWLYEIYQHKYDVWLNIQHNSLNDEKFNYLPLSPGSIVSLSMRTPHLPGRLLAREKLKLRSFDRNRRMCRAGATELAPPQVSAATAKKTEKLFNSLNLIKGKAVFIAPQASWSNNIMRTNDAMLKFWQVLVSEIIKAGMIPVLNQRNHDACVNYAGVAQVDIPLEQVIPFVELCGAIVAQRSGISDLTAFTKAKRYTVYPMYLINWSEDLSDQGVISVELKQGEEISCAKQVIRSLNGEKVDIFQSQTMKHVYEQIII